MLLTVTKQNQILGLHVKGVLVTNEPAMAQVAFEHLSSILGSTPPRDYTMYLEAIDPRNFHLSALEIPFSEAEI